MKTSEQINSKTNLEILSSHCNTETCGNLLRYDIIEYRGYKINFLLDPMGNHVFAQWENNVVDLGLHNIFYKEEMCRFIDRKLDLITTFPKLPEFRGAKLEWFHNGSNRDIKLSYKDRLVKVFLIADPDQVNLDKLIKESTKLLKFSGLLEKAKI